MRVRPSSAVTGHEQSASRRPARGVARVTSAFPGGGPADKSVFGGGRVLSRKRSFIRLPQQTSLLVAPLVVWPLPTYVGLC